MRCGTGGWKSEEEERLFRECDSELNLNSACHSGAGEGKGSPEPVLAEGPAHRGSEAGSGTVATHRLPRDGGAAKEGAGKPRGPYCAELPVLH